jgi:hypothetical protein
MDKVQKYNSFNNLRIEIKESPVVLQDMMKALHTKQSLWGRKLPMDRCKLSTGT